MIQILFHQLLHLINTCDGCVVFRLVVGLFVAFFLDDFWFGIGYEAFVRELLTDHIQFFLPFSQFLVETSELFFDIEEVCERQVTSQLEQGESQRL